MLHLLTTLPRRNEWVFSAPPAPPAACASPTNRTSALAKPLVSKGLPCTGRAVRSQDRRSVWKSRGRGCANSGSQTRRHGRKALHGAPAGPRRNTHQIDATARSLKAVARGQFVFEGLIYGRLVWRPQPDETEQSGKANTTVFGKPPYIRSNTGQQKKPAIDKIAGFLCISWGG